MRTISLFVALLLLTVRAQDFGDPGFVGSLTAPASSGGTPTYLVNQNFEGAGYDNSETWTEVGTVDPDEATIVLRGSQSLKIATAGSDGYTTSPAFTALDTLHVAFRFRVDTTVSAVHLICVGYLNTTSVWRLQTDTTAHLVVRHGTTSSTAGATALSTNVTYYIWIDYTKGTGADGTMACYLSTTRTKPGSAEASLSNGNGTDQTDRLRLMGDYASSQDITVYFDQVLVDDETIGDLAE